MKTMSLGGKLSVPEIGLGCMRINILDKVRTESYIRTAIELGVNFFDHADIYGGGECEAHFSQSLGMTPALRETMILQTKCAIRPGICYDFSREHILSSVEGSLRRLRTDYIDILLLHRPDALMEPQEVAEAFAALRQAGKVRYFGVSNHNSYQIALLSRYLGEDAIIANQMQLSITDCPMIDHGLNVNTGTPHAVDRDNGTLDYCRLHGISIQAWAPLRYRFSGGKGVFIGSEKFPELNEKLGEIAGRYGVTPPAVAVAWILRHPAKIQAIMGTTNADRLGEVCRASGLTLSREEWYELYLAGGKTLP